ncbi:MAG: ATP-binding cassette domain-containing protein [Nitrospirae bacterium]|nr:ATP-binding cassette domain-containing protein [Nitrospirota bacterium]
MNNIAISVEEVGMTFVSGKRKTEVFDNISFNVNKKELLCIVGPSGCGKSTLLRIMLSLIEPSKGKVSISPQMDKESIAYIQQQPFLLPWRTLIQNAVLGVELKNDLNSETIKRVKNLIEEYGLKGFEDYLPFELSGGMKHRAEIVRVLGSRAKLLFCDEPFTALDFVTRLDLNTRFKGMTKNYGVTTVFITHNIEEAIFLGDRIIVLGKKPAEIVSTHTVKLSIGSEDAVKCRQSPEFADLFIKIWEDLRA